MPPTEALFDAINRGDMPAARDALSRGADFTAENVLGMTPLDLSVDLGRNDITFLLLSLHGGGGSERARALASSTPPAPGKPGQGKAEAAAARQTVPSAAYARLTATMRAVRPQAAAPGLAPASVRYAGSDPGVAVPQAGFLGFGSATP